MHPGPGSTVSTVLLVSVNRLYIANEKLEREVLLRKSKVYFYP